MKAIKIKNEDGETIEIKFNADGEIQIRHSDIDRKRWAVLHEYSKRVRLPGLKAVMESALKAKPKVSAAQVSELLGRMGGYVILDGDSMAVPADEMALIYQAVKQAGGIVPNWSAQA